MKIGVQGTKEFRDYNVLMRAMGVALSSIKDDPDFTIYSAGPAQVNSYVTEFCNMSENNLKARGIRVRHHMVPPSFIKDHLKEIDYFAFLSAPNQRRSQLTAEAELANIEVGIFQY